MKFAQFILFSFLFVSCSSILSKSQNDDRILSKIMSDGSTDITPVTNNLDEEVKQITGPIELRDHDMVRKWIHYFSTKDKDRFQRFLNRGFYYKEVVQTMLEENGLPNELYYLAMIESGYVSHARSHASAVGTWQFMKRTAKGYGLEVNYYIDERKDPIRSTEAAGKYLKDLYTVFKSWELALAAYNWGEHRVLTTIMRGDTRDFWALLDKGHFPRETKNYIPKFMAAVLIGEDPERYGFEDPEKLALESFPNVEAVEVPSPATFAEISKKIGVDEDLLAKANMHLRRKMTPPHYEKYEIWVPSTNITFARAQAANIERTKVSRKAYLYPTKNYYTVRRGDTLSGIARKFNERVGHIKRLNNLRSSRIYVGQRLRISAKAYSSTGKSPYYFVKSGDNLSQIARAHGMSVAQLKRMNGIRGSRIYVGQKLKLTKMAKTYYRVRRGDNLSKIARQFGVSVHELKRRNSLRSTRIYVGQKLKI